MKNFKTTEQVPVSQIISEPPTVEICTVIDNDFDFLGDSCDFS